MAEFNRVQGSPNNERDENIVIQKFMAELCRRDQFISPPFLLPASVRFRMLSHHLVTTKGD